jgi:hypothetical protein
VGTYPNEWLETSVSAAYGGIRRMKMGSKAPGMLAFTGSNASIYPEDYNEAGSLWEHLERNRIDFFNFGFGLEMAPGYEEQAFKYTGVRTMINYPLPAPLYGRSSRLFATFNMGIPDQFRTDMFIREFNDRWTGPGKKLPRCSRWCCRRTTGRRNGRRTATRSTRVTWPTTTWRWAGWWNSSHARRTGKTWPSW